MGRSAFRYTRVLLLLALANCAAPFGLSKINYSQTTATLRVFQPAFAVRAMACVTCHGTFSSNIVTDFGAGDGRFFQGAYGNWGDDSWQTATVHGSVIMPNMAIPNVSAMSILSGNTVNLFSAYTMPASPSLADLMVAAVTLHLPDANGIIQTYYPGSPMEGVTPANGKAGLVQKNTISIKVPTVQQILAVGGQTSVGLTPLFKELGGASETGNLSGLSYSDTVPTANSYVRNTPGATMTCKGDVFINGPLLLKNLTLSTDTLGCRLYVTGTVVIDGPVTYTVAHNLQIASASAVLFGFNLASLGVYTSDRTVNNVTHVRYLSESEGTQYSTICPVSTGKPCNRMGRLADDRTLYMDPTSALGPSNGKAFFDSIGRDARKMASQMTDALHLDGTCPQNNCSADAVNGGLPRTTINYDGMLLNAPHIHSRYLGLFKGVVIAEVSMFAIYQTNFAFDPIFANSDIAILPLAGWEPLIVQ